MKRGKFAKLRQSVIVNHTGTHYAAHATAYRRASLRLHLLRVLAKQSLMKRAARALHTNTDTSAPCTMPTLPTRQQLRPPPLGLLVQLPLLRPLQLLPLKQMRR